MMNALDTLSESNLGAARMTDSLLSPPKATLNPVRWEFKIEFMWAPPPGGLPRPQR